MVIDITHTSLIMYQIFFHAYSITQWAKTHNDLSNIFSIIYISVTALGREKNSREKIQIMLNGDYECYLLCTDMHNPTLSSR